MRTLPLRFFVCAPILVLAAHASAVELIKNGSFGFTTGTLDYWTHDGVVSNGFSKLIKDFASASNEKSHSTYFSADFGVQNDTTMTYSETIGQNFSPVAATDVTSMTFWAYSVYQDIHVDFLYSDSTSTNLVMPVYGASNLQNNYNNGWTMFNLLPALDRTKTLTGIDFHADSESRLSTNDIFIDDVSVQAVPEPAPMAALGLGALGLLKRRRR